MLFGHHFAAIAGAGPLIGPVLAAQFGYAPGLIWLVGGVCLAGAVHDMIVLWASTRRGGASLADIARSEIGPVAGTTAAVAILFIVIIALAGLGLAVVNALEHSAWGTFTIGMSIPLALVRRLVHVPAAARAASTEATIIGVAGLLACVVLGKPLASSSLGHYFLFSRTQLILLMAGYGFIASVLPVWLLLAPRDYLSSFMKIGTIALLIVGVIVVNPVLQMPAFSQFTAGGGPIVPGPLFPVRVHHHRVRRDLRIPRAHLVGDDAEDDRQRVRHPADRLRRDADGGRRRHRVAHRRQRDAPRRLLRHQHVAGGVRDPRA